MNKELEDILQHHGILGMKWGKHKKKDSVDITNAKSEVVNRKADVKALKQQLNRDTLKTGGYVISAQTRKTQNQLRGATRELKYAKQDVSKLKILDKIGLKEKSEYQLKMESKYKAKGMSDDEATVAAYKNIRFKKIAATAAVTTLAVAGTYAGYKIKNERFDKIIKSGKTLQQVSDDSNVGVRDAFYSATHPMDKIKYKGLYGNQLRDGGSAVFKKEIKTLTDIKQASPKNARKILEDLVKNDPEFAAGFKEHMTPKNITERLGSVYGNKVRRGTPKDIYEVFNAGLVDHIPSAQKLTDRYLKEMTSKGYNALKDVNDSKYSGYNSVNPILTFGSKGKVAVVNVAELAKKEIDKNQNIVLASIAGGQYVKQGAVAAAAYASVTSGSSKVNSNKTEKQVAKYLKEHPNSKLSYTDITRNIERSNSNAS